MGEHFDCPFGVYPKLTSIDHRLVGYRSGDASTVGSALRPSYWACEQYDQNRDRHHCLDNDVEGRTAFAAALYIPGKAMTKESDMALSPSARAIKSVGLPVGTHSLYLALIAAVARESSGRWKVGEAFVGLGRSPEHRECGIRRHT